MINSSNKKENIQKNEISFTLHPAHSKVGRGNLGLRQSVPHFLPNSRAILERNARVEWQKKEIFVLNFKNTLIH